MQSFIIPDFGECRVTFEPMSNSVPKALQAEYLLLLEFAQKNPKSVLEKVEQFYRVHSGFPEIVNLLSFVYLRVAKIKEAEALIQESYEKYPAYFFAKINYADQCLRKGRQDEIPKIFSSSSFNKRIYHYSEVRGFAVVMGFYHLGLQNRDKAEELYQLALKLDPNHSSVSLLGKKIFKTSFLKKILARFS